MRYATWMVVFIAAIVWADIPRTNTVEYKVDYFELNHCYDNKGKCYLDQIIMWDWADYEYMDDKRTKKRREKKVVDWYLVSKYRPKLTEEEQRKKDNELAKEWVKKFGKGADNNAPPYNPPFQGGILIPRLDHGSRMWRVIMVKKTHTIKIYGTSFVETWTQFDPEVDNKTLFRTDTRRNILRKKYASNR